MTLLTRGLRAAQPMASWAVVTPISAATSDSLATAALRAGCVRPSRRKV